MSNEVKNTVLRDFSDLVNVAQKPSTAIETMRVLLARVERLEQALRKIEHPAHLLNEFMPNCAGCIARAALNDEEVK